jgi:hypothetical protein
MLPVGFGGDWTGRLVAVGSILFDLRMKFGVASEVSSELGGSRYLEGRPRREVSLGWREVGGKEKVNRPSGRSRDFARV